MVKVPLVVPLALAMVLEAKSHAMAPLVSALLLLLFSLEAHPLLMKPTFQQMASGEDL